MPSPLPPLSAEESDALWRAYRGHRTPRDQFDRKPRILVSITELFNLLTGLRWTEDMVYRAILTRCKNPKRYNWGNHENDYEQLQSIRADYVPPEYLSDVGEIYKTICMGADRYKYSGELRHRFALALESQTGFKLSTDLVGAYLVDLRKSGLLPKLEGDGKTAAFDDFDVLPNPDNEEPE